MIFDLISLGCTIAMTIALKLELICAEEQFLTALRRFCMKFPRVAIRSFFYRFLFVQNGKKSLFSSYKLIYSSKKSKNIGLYINMIDKGA